MPRTPAIAARPARLRDGTPVLLRGQGPHDRALLAQLFAGLSGRSRYMRFMAGMPPALPSGMLDALSAVDDVSHVGVLALRGDRPIGAARYVRSALSPEEADVAFTVADAYHRRGLAGLMTRELLEHAASRGIARLTFEMLGENRAAAALARSLGATVRFAGGQLVATLPVAPPAAGAEPLAA